MSKKIIVNSIIVVVGILLSLGILKSIESAELTGFRFSCSASALEEEDQSVFSQNDITFYDPTCYETGGPTADSSFRIDESVSAADFWYPEGCLVNCSGGHYAHTQYDTANPFLRSDTKTDDDFGGMQYIYAENYDFDLDAWPPKLTKKSDASSTRKYYWVVLPAEAYSNGFGETYVATFEKISEPVYFITFDTHQCKHQSEKYCEKAKADPDGVKAGKEFFGAITKNAGNANGIVEKAGKLTSLHRINGRGEVLAKEVSNNSSRTGSTTPTSGGSGSSDGDTCPKLGKDRTAMWEEASQADKNSFMYVVSKEDHSIAGVEGYMNQALWYSYAHDNKSNILNYWLNHQCPGFRGGASCSSESYSISSEEQKWLDDALAGSNNLNFATGSATGGSSVGVGKIACVWDGEKCRTDVDYNKQDGTGGCNVYSPSASFGECWGYDSNPDSVEKWIDENYSDCGNCNSYEGDYPEYYQYDEPWGSMTYNSGTIASRGCGVCSIAMLATVLTGQDITPDTVLNDLSGLSNNDYPNNDYAPIDEYLGKKYGFEVEKVSVSNTDDQEKKMRQYLKDGYMIHVSAHGSAPFTSGGHFIGIYNIDNDDNVIVANSANRSKKTSSKQWKLHDIAKHISSRGYFTAIKGNGSGKNTCSGLCTLSNETKVGEAAGIPLEERMNWLFPEGTPTSPEQMAKYLEDTSVPILNESGKQTTMTLKVHKKLATEIQAVFQDMVNIGFKIKADETGGYTWRYMASGTGHLSHHSYGVAIDVNWNDNPATYTGGHYAPGSNPYSVTDKVVEVWKKHGFYWGGDWSGHYKDYMHFTYTNH